MGQRVYNPRIVLVPGVVVLVPNARVYPATTILVPCPSCEGTGMVLMQ